jgi:diguanylate cyclase (GGDEF)-like protein
MHFQTNNFSIAIPITILVVATGLVFSHHNFSLSVLEMFRFLPYAFASVAIWLSIQFSRRQLLVSVLISVASYVVIQQLLQQPLAAPLPLTTYTVLCLCVPISLLINQVVPETGLLSNSSRLVYLCLAIIVGVALWWIQVLDETALIWVENHFPTRPLPLLIVSLNALAVIATSLGVSFFLFMSTSSSVSLSLFFILLANVLPLVFFDQPMISTAYLSGSMVIALFACIKTSHELAYRDQLTGLLGRRALFEQLRSVSGRYTIAMLDIDHFKKFNDTYGHDVGDDVLAMVATKISEVGGKGQAYRYGGEEFTLLFTGKDAQSALPYLDEVRQNIESTAFAIRDKEKRQKGSQTQRSKQDRGPKTVQITVSIGAATKPTGRVSSESVLKIADKALYKAKEKGRNQVQLAE